MPSGCMIDALRVCRTTEGIEEGYSWRRKKKENAVVFLFVMILIILNYQKFANPSKQSSKRIKRQSKTTDFDNNRNVKSNIEIVPEKRKIYYHPNHRYGEESENSKNMKVRLKIRKGWYPQPTELKRDNHPRNIQEVILKGKISGPRGKRQDQVLKELMEGSASKMRLKGVYVHDGRGDDVLLGSHGTYYDSKEINNLVRNDSGVAGKLPLQKWFKSPGAPFKLPINGREGPRRQALDQRSKARPLTIYLDFYPMIYSGEVGKRKPESDISPSNKLRGPLSGHSVGSHNGIIMKLNLHPKEFERYSGRKTFRSKYNKRAGDRSFGWFSKHDKKKDLKACSLLGKNSRITARWKNEKGEWIHAEHVDIKESN